jgi:hypothetical protein
LHWTLDAVLNIMPSLLSAAKYLVREYGFTPIYNDDPIFSDPVIPASQQMTFAALNLLASVATDQDIMYVNVRRVTDWLGQKSLAANAR